MPETPPPTSHRLSRPNDARARRSREALKVALLHLLEMRTFEQISIREITRTAGLSYPVFFRQFRNKEELLADLAREEVRKILSLAQVQFDPSQAETGLFAMCQHVQRHKALWRTLLTAGASGEMRSEFAAISAEIAHKGPRSNPWLPIELASSFAAAAIFEILAWWLGQPSDIPIEHVVRILSLLASRPLIEPHDVHLDWPHDGDSDTPLTIP